MLGHICCLLFNGGRGPDGGWGRGSCSIARSILLCEGMSRPFQLMLSKDFFSSESLLLIELLYDVFREQGPSQGACLTINRQEAQIKESGQIKSERVLKETLKREKEEDKRRRFIPKFRRND